MAEDAALVMGSRGSHVGSFTNDKLARFHFFHHPQTFPPPSRNFLQAYAIRASSPIGFGLSGKLQSPFKPTKHKILFPTSNPRSGLAASTLSVPQSSRCKSCKWRDSEQDRESQNCQDHQYTFEEKIKQKQKQRCFACLHGRNVLGQVVRDTHSDPMLPERS